LAASFYFLSTSFISRAMRFTDPTCRLSFAVISRIRAPSRTKRVNACLSTSVHSFGFGFIAYWRPFSERSSYGTPRFILNTNKVSLAGASVDPMSESDNANMHRLRAVMCHQRAEQTRDPELKRAWEELAIEWHHLASEVSRVAGDDDQIEVA
jgi:hypothetical protein